VVRFFVNKSEISGQLINLSDEDKAHVRSLRLRPTEEFVVCDGEGVDYICVLDGDSGFGLAKIVSQEASKGEASIAATMYIALAKGERLEYAIQKSIELGAEQIVLFLSKRCVSVPKDMDKNNQISKNRTGNSKAMRTWDCTAS